MSDVIDTSVVKLGFDNREFINNVNMSIMAVDSLKDSLTFDSKSFDSLSKAASNIDLSAVASNIESLSNRFSTFGIVGMTAIQRITNEVMTLAGKLGGLLMKPWNQIVSGGWSRASNIGQAKFQLEGLFGKTEEGVAKLNMTMMATGEQVAQLAQEAQGYSEDMIVAMNAADYAVADTAYGLDSAAKAASVLATSGVDVVHFSEDLKDANGLMRTEMQVALRGISGVAAMANREYDDVARIFERVSGAGRVMGDDLNSLASYGLNAAATLRDYLNEVGVTANATEKDIRDMVSKGEIDFMTFAKAMDSAYGDHAKDANNTFSGAFSNMKFALSKIGADFISPIRSKMVPLFNDIRIAINQVRKALNFKMKFPGIEEEISIVELFTRIITNLSNKIHDFFTVWHGGQNVMEQAMAGFANFTGESFENIKSVFDAFTDGTIESKDAISKLSEVATKQGKDLSDVYKNLGETLGKTEGEIKSMCLNGTISFEDFYSAMSNVFGSDIQDTRISQWASLIHGITQGLWNLARTITSIVGPVIYAFFQVFNVGGMKGIVGITQAFAEFTKTLILSRGTQEKVRSLAYNLFMILKSGIKVVKRLASAAFKVLQSLAPLFVYILDFADVLASVISYIVDIVTESNLLSSAVTVLGKIIYTTGYLILNVFKILLALIEPAIRGLGEVFAFLARSIGSIDLSFIGTLIDEIVELVNVIANGGVVQTLTTIIAIFFGTIGSLFKGLNLSFAIICQTLQNVAERIASICDRIITIVKNMKNAIVMVFKTLFDFIKSLDPRQIIAIIGQLTSLTILYRFAQTMRGIGRTFSGLGNYLNSNAILAFTNAIKTLARAVLEFAVAIVLLSSIPKEQLGTTVKLLIALTAAVSVFLAIYFYYMYKIAELNGKIQADPMVRFMNKLNASINSFLQSIGRATNIAALSLLLISAAASVLILFKAVKMFATLDTTEMQDGFSRIGLVLLLIGTFLTMLLVAAKPNSIGGNVKDSVIFGNSGMMGAALVMLALIVVLKEFQNVITQYHNLHLGGEAEWEATFKKIGAVMVVITGGLALLGLTTKRAGIGLMGSVTVMLGFINVLNSFIPIIVKYAKLMHTLNTKFTEGEITATFITIAGIIFALTAGIAVISAALTDAGGSSLSASIKNGIQFQNNSAKFLGVVLMLLGICVVLKSLESMMITINLVGLEASISAMLTLAVILAGLFAALKAVKGVQVGSVIGIGVVLIALASILPILTMFETMDLLGGATSLLLVIYSLSFVLKALSANGLSWQKGLGYAILMVAVITMVMGALAVLQRFEAANILSSGLALASVISALGLALKLVSTAKFNPQAIIEMAMILMMMLPFMYAITAISTMNFEPAKLLVLMTTVSMLAIALSAAVKILSGTVIENSGSVFVALIGIASMLSILAFALVGATNMLSGKITDFGLIALFINALIPIIASLVGLSILTSKFSNMTGVGMLAIIVALVAGLASVFGYITLIADADETVSLIRGLSDCVLELSAFLGVLAILSIALGAIAMTGIGAAGLAAGIGLVGALLAEIGVFLGMVAFIATLGDAKSTAYLLDGLGESLDAMIPFLLKMGGICALFGMVSPLLGAGAIGFGVLLTIMAQFVGMIAAITNVGNPEDTITLLNGLIGVMDIFDEFLGHFVLVLTLMGVVAPLVALGSIVFDAILKILSNFALSMAAVSNVGNSENTISVMSSITEAMKELVSTFTVIMILGIMAAPVIAGLFMITTAVSMLLAVSYIIGRIDVIKDSIESGIATMMLAATSLVTFAAIINQLDLVNLAKFVTALLIIGMAPLSGILKFTAISGMFTILSSNSRNIEKGSDLCIKMVKDLAIATGIIEQVTRKDTKGLVNVTDDILRSSANLALISKYIGEWIPLSIASGLVDGTALATLASCGILMSKVLEESIRNTLQVHSESPLYNGIGGWLPKSIGTGMIEEAPGMISDSTTIMDSLGKNTFNLAGQWGTASGGNFISSMEDAIVSGLNYLKENNVFNDYYQYFANGVITEHTARVTGMTASDTETINDYTRAVDKYHDAMMGDPRFNSDTWHYEADEEDWIDEMFPDMSDLSWLLEGIGDSFDLGTITDSFGDLGSSLDDLNKSAGASSKSVNDLTNKIDDLMEKYEKIWDDAKERANKDLFKGVDDQGDDFLDSVKEIMDKYKNIYQSAVEKTNSEDLFAEVKDEDESFAPETLINNLEDQVNQVNELNTIIGSLSGRIADNGLRAAISNMSVDDLPELRAMYRMDNSQLAKYEQMYKQKVQANQNKIQNELTGSLSQLTGQYTNVATYVATDASTDRLVHNLQAQVNQLNEYNSTVASLCGRIKDVNLREAIAHMGVDSLEELKALNSMTDKQLDEYVALYNQKISSSAVSIKNELSTELSSLLGEPVDIDVFYQSWKQSMEEMQKAIDEGGDAKKVGRKTGNDIGTETTEGMKDSNVMIQARNTGRSITDKMAEGIIEEDGVRKVQENLTSVIEKTKEYLESELKTAGFKECGGKIIQKICLGIQYVIESRDFRDEIYRIADNIEKIALQKEATYEQIGQHIINGIALGMEFRKAYVTIVASKIINAVVVAARQAAKIKSPSRVFMEIGKYMDEGLAIGLRDYSNLAEDEAGNMANGTVSAVQEAISQLSGMLDGSIDVNPTITPTLDLSEVNAKSTALANMFNGRQVAVQAYADDRQAEMMTQLGDILAEQNSEPRSVVFNQTNNSPKALSNAEIYRQTKNGFSRLVGAYT